MDHIAKYYKTIMNAKLAFMIKRVSLNLYCIELHIK